MSEFLTESSFFAIALTLLVWRLACDLQKKTGSALLHPILVSAAALILFSIVLTITCINLLVSRKK